LTLNHLWLCQPKHFYLNWYEQISGLKNRIHGLHRNNKIKHASLFDLYRLNTAIHYELENPERIKQLRNTFKEGDIISYFDASNKRLEQAMILQKNFKSVLVENINDHKK
jgi:hypothetical protein